MPSLLPSLQGILYLGTKWMSTSRTETYALLSVAVTTQIERTTFLSAIWVMFRDLDTRKGGLGLQKGGFLYVKKDGKSGDAAVRLAFGETPIIEENPRYSWRIGLCWFLIRRTLVLCLVFMSAQEDKPISRPATVGGPSCWHGRLQGTPSSVVVPSGSGQTKSSCSVSTIGDASAPHAWNIKSWFTFSSNSGIPDRHLAPSGFALNIHSS